MYIYITTGDFTDPFGKYSPRQPSKKLVEGRGFWDETI